MFRYEPSSRRFVRVPRSGVATDGSYAWAVLHRPGIYRPIGLPADPERFDFLVTLYGMKPLLRWLGEHGQIGALRDALESRDKLTQLFGAFGNDPDLHLPGILGGMRTRGGRVPGLPPGLPGGLPEFDILDDICPPWRGRGIWEKPDPLLLPGFDRRPWPPFLWGWHAAGPSNFSGRIKSVAICPANRNVVYAGTADGGVWKSANGGATWQATMFTELSMAIGAIDVSVTHPNTVYAATGEDTPGWGPSYPGVGAYKSTDAGATWTLTGSGVFASPGESLDRRQLRLR